MSASVLLACASFIYMHFIQYDTNIGIYHGTHNQAISNMLHWTKQNSVQEISFGCFSSTYFQKEFACEQVWLSESYAVPCACIIRLSKSIN